MRSNSGASPARPCRAAFSFLDSAAVIGTEYRSSFFSRPISAAAFADFGIISFGFDGWS